MRKFKITVDGREFAVTVEEVQGNKTATGLSGTEPRPAGSPAGPPTAPATAPETVLPGGFAVPAPMPGLIVEIPVKAGDTVAAGDVIVILEAMKMENEVTTPVGGTVTAVMVKKGDSVDTGTPLLTIS